MSVKQKYLGKIDHNINLLSCVKKNLLGYMDMIKTIQYQNLAQGMQPSVIQSQGRNLEKRKLTLEKSLEMFLVNYKEVEDYKNYEKNQVIKDGFEEIAIKNQYFQVEKRISLKDINFIKNKEQIVVGQRMISIHRVNSPLQVIIFIRQIPQQGSQQQFSVQDLLVCPIPKRKNNSQQAIQDGKQQQQQQMQQIDDIAIPEHIPQVFKEISAFVKIVQKKLEHYVFLEMFFPTSPQQDYFSRVFSPSTTCEYCNSYMKFKSPKEGFLPPTFLYNNKLYHTQCFKEKEFI